METVLPSIETALHDSAVASQLHPRLAAPGDRLDHLQAPRRPASRTRHPAAVRRAGKHSRTVLPRSPGLKLAAVCCLRMRAPRPRKRAPEHPPLLARRRRPAVRCLRDCQQAARPPPGIGVRGPARSALLRPRGKLVKQVSLKEKVSGRTGSHPHVPFLSGDGFHPGTPHGRLFLSLHGSICQGFGAPSDGFCVYSTFHLLYLILKLYTEMEIVITSVSF